MTVFRKTWFRVVASSLGVLAVGIGIAAIAMAAENSVLKEIISRINKQKSLIAQVQKEYESTSKRSRRKNKR